MNKFYSSLQNSKKIHKGNSTIVNRKKCEQKIYNEKNFK